jgi:hypothetical protein
MHDSVPARVASESGARESGKRQLQRQEAAAAGGKRVVVVPG